MADKSLTVSLPVCARAVNLRFWRSNVLDHGGELMRNYLLHSAWVVSLAVLAGCTPDRPFQPGTDYPEWAYDKREYKEPAEEPIPYYKGTDGEPDIYRSQQRLVFIKRPHTPDIREVPRPAVYVTSDEGQKWEKMGYFGLEQRYFALAVKEDGDYGICIVGKDLRSVAPGNLKIQLIYEIDSTTPSVDLQVLPEKGPYLVGQAVVLKWTITDAHVGALPGELYSRYVIGSRTSQWTRRQVGLAPSGSIAVTLDQPAGSQFRVKAIDEFGNVGLGHTPLLELEAYAGGSAEPGPAGESMQPPPPPQTIVVPPSAPEPETPSENVPPWSWRAKPPSEPSAPPSVLAEPGEQEIESETIPELAIVPVPEPTIEQSSQARTEKQQEVDSELAELEALLAKVSGPVYAGRVLKSPEPKALAKTEPSEVPPVGEVVLRPADEQQFVEKPMIIVAPEPKARIAQGGPEVNVEIMPPPIIAEQPSPAEPIVTVRPVEEAQVEPEIVVAPSVEPELPILPELETVLAAPEPEPVLERPVFPEPKPEIVLVEPEPEPIVVVQPTAPEITTPEPKQPSPVPPPQPRVVAGASHGKEHMAKPWERLGNRAAAARDFYIYSPSLANF